MTFRYARHTNAIKPLIEFYTQIIGLKNLGDFKDHSGYNGVFLGYENSDWHLEFTESKEKVMHHPDDDDLIVFYFKTLGEFNQVKDRVEKWGIPIETSKNPYWQQNGIEIKDPDKFGVILTIDKC